jgi:XTP/dITP diphosphohydrolase
MIKLIFATNNQHKAREIQGILGKRYHILSLYETGFTEDIPEDHDTLEANAMQKAKYIHDRLGGNVFADDTGLEVDVLGGDPGVYSARFAELTGDRMEGEEAADANIRKLLKKMDGSDNRRARFHTVIALILDAKEYTFEGIVEGLILTGRRGKEGFGYDPVFMPEGYTESFAEMQPAEKNAISHRGHAVEKLVDFLNNYHGL